jgi:uncharacterized membrane protein SpoIIM required for sporulation
MANAMKRSTLANLLWAIIGAVIGAIFLGLLEQSFACAVLGAVVGALLGWINSRTGGGPGSGDCG